MNDFGDVFIAYGVDKVISPPQPVSERDIVSSPRTVYQAWYRISIHGSNQFLTFKTEEEGWYWLSERAAAVKRGDV